MTTPTPRHHTEKPDTPPAGPSGVSHQTPTTDYRQILDDIAKAMHLGPETGGYHYADLPRIAGRLHAQLPLPAVQYPDVQQALRRVNDVIGGALRQIAAITGQTDPAPAGAPHHLDAMEQAWDEGYGDCVDDDAGSAINPYRKLIDDRREFVRQQVEDGFGTLSYPPTSDTAFDDCENVLGDDNAEWFDAVLDAHDEWLALQQRKATS
ncbi:hypothetical protein SEA_PHROSTEDPHLAKE_84 [Gordonia phage PhrostedPhlake]|nr:hypothetical protein SEA_PHROSTEDPHLAKE_84 [Gordonia phage PhrostedPhlake]